MTERKQLDLLDGVREIADYLGQPEKQTGYEIRMKRWPVFRMGRKVKARKSELDARASASANTE